MNIIKSTGTFSFYTLISRVLGYFRDILIAIFLGSGAVADAFFVAFRIPNTFRRLFGEGSFNAAFVPSYSKELVKGKKKSHNFANDILNLLTLFLLGFVIIIELLMPIFVTLIAPGFKSSPEKFALAIQLTKITFPFILFVSLASFFSAILNSHDKFAVASASPIILNLVLITILISGKIIGEDLVVYLSYGVSFAGFLQMIFLIIFVKKYFKPSFKLTFKISKEIKLFFKKLLPSIFSSGVTQINILVGTIIASFQASAVSYLYYADRIYQINLAIAGIAIGTIILPKLSMYIQQKRKKDIEIMQNKSLQLSLFLSLPAMLGLIIVNEEIVSSLFGYGSFNELSVKNSAQALFYFSLGLPAFSLIKIFSSFIFARDNTKTPFNFSLISVLINVIISVYFFSDYGFIVIPIATSISSWIHAIILYIYLHKYKLFKISFDFTLNLIRIIFSSILMAMFLYGFISFFEDQLIYDNSLKVIYLFFLIILSIVIYIIISLVTKAFKFSDIKIKY
tara:strand:- start:13779 stop:15308 length:1530 start_codon:yes stop_codon:yes gene_type:complete